MTRPTLHRSTVALAIVAVAALALVGIGSATVVDRGHYSGSGEKTDDGCGTAYHVAYTFGGTYLLRLGLDGEAFPEQINYWVNEIWTNQDTGKWFVWRSNGILKDVKAVQIGTSTVYKFTRIEAGQPFVMEDMDGGVVVRDRGSIRYDYLWDTLGDGEPGGVWLGLDGVRINGPHPAFADDFPYCDIAAELTAAE